MDVQNLSSATNSFDSFSSIQNKDQLVIDLSLHSSTNDQVHVGEFDTSKSLTLTAQQILDKINKLIADKVPNGIESLDTSKITPESTADTIVTGITALFDKYKKSNPELSAADALEKFMAAARSGVSSGYDDAYKSLDSLGAFQIDGVKDSVEQTKVLIDSKLDAFEKYQRDQLASTESSQVSQETQSTTPKQSN